MKIVLNDIPIDHGMCGDFVRASWPQGVSHIDGADRERDTDDDSQDELQ